MTDYNGDATEGCGALLKNNYSEIISTACSELAAAETTKTAEKPACNSTIERVCVDGAEVLQRWKDGFAACDWTGPTPTGNVWFFEKLDDGCRRITAKCEDETDDTHDRSVYEDFNCPDADDPGSGGGGFQIEVLASHKRDSTGDLAHPATCPIYSEALDARATKFLKAKIPGPDLVPLEHRCEKASGILKAIDAERQALRGLHRREQHETAQVEIAKKLKRARPIGDRNAALRNEEALGWLKRRVEDDPDLERGRLEVVIPWLLSGRSPPCNPAEPNPPMSLRAFAALKGLDRTKTQRMVNRYADHVARRVNADGGALAPILARANYESPPESPPEPDKTYRYRFWLKEPVREKCRGRRWPGAVFLYQPQPKLDCTWLDAALDAADNAFFATSDQTRQRKALASHTLHE